MEDVQIEDVREDANCVAEEEVEAFVVEAHLHRYLDPSSKQQRERVLKWLPSLFDEREHVHHHLTFEGCQLRAAARDVALAITQLNSSENAEAERIRELVADSIHLAVSHWLRADAVGAVDADMFQSAHAPPDLSNSYNSTAKFDAVPAAPGATYTTSKSWKKLRRKGTHVRQKIFWPLDRRGRPLLLRQGRNWYDQLVGKRTAKFRPSRRPRVQAKAARLTPMHHSTSHHAKSKDASKQSTGIAEQSCTIGSANSAFSRFDAASAGKGNITNKGGNAALLRSGNDMHIREQLRKSALKQERNAKRGYAALMPITDAARHAGIPDAIIERARMRLRNSPEWSSMQHALMASSAQDDVAQVLFSARTGSMHPPS